MASPGSPAAAIPPEFEDLFHGSALAQLATLRRDGTPQLTPVWIDLEDGLLLVNVRSDRLKAGNMTRRGDVAICVVDPANAHRFVSVTGVVESVSDEGTMAHMDRLAARYLSVKKYPWAIPGEHRLLFRIRPRTVFVDRGDVQLPPADI